MQYDIIITGTIGGWDCLSVGYVRYLLNQKKDKDVHVGFCSLGGYVKDGLEMNQAFRDHGKVHAHAFGMNASISTIAMLGCATIDISKDSLFLIHNCSTVILKYDQQNKEQLDEYIKEITKQRNDLNTFDDLLAQMYADKTGKSKEDCAAQMKKGNWLTAQQASDFGLVDGIREEEKDDRAQDLLNKQMNAFHFDNKFYEEAGIPPLPKPQSRSARADVADGDGNPTPRFLQKTLQGLKNLLHPNNVENNHKQMSKTTLSAIAKLLAVDAVPMDDEGKVTLTADQAALLDRKISSMKETSGKGESEEQKPAENAVSAEEIKAVKDEIKALKESIASKDEQIKNLQGSPAPTDETKENPKDEHPAPSALDIYNAIKDI